jgi:hypothetical protein
VATGAAHAVGHSEGRHLLAVHDEGPAAGRVLLDRLGTAVPSLGDGAGLAVAPLEGGGAGARFVVVEEALAEGEAPVVVLDLALAEVGGSPLVVLLRCATRGSVGLAAGIERIPAVDDATDGHGRV